jgi:hypothetical protein
MTVSGESVTQKKTFYQTLTTDSLGEARYSLDKGTFRVSFSSRIFQPNTNCPLPFFSILKLPGQK